MLKQIEAVLEKHVRPQLISHQGNVEIVEYTEGNVLKVRLTGRCSGCPSATLTTEELIKSEVQNHLPQVNDVVLVNEISKDLMAQARAILNGSAKK